MAEVRELKEVPFCAECGGMLKFPIGGICDCGVSLGKPEAIIVGLFRLVDVGRLYKKQILTNEISLEPPFWGAGFIGPEETFEVFSPASRNLAWVLSSVPPQGDSRVAYVAMFDTNDTKLVWRWHSGCGWIENSTEEIPSN